MTQADPATLAYYDQHAEAFVEATVGASMGGALGRFAALLPVAARVLDWGCGSGRDSLALRRHGFEVVSVDASHAMAEQALVATGTTVRVESFGQLEEVGAFDGIWACASLLHVMPADLPGVFERAARALRDGGVLYCSFKKGSFRGLRDGRWFTDLEADELAALLAPHLEIAQLWESEDVRPERKGQQWLNCLAIRRAGPDCHQRLSGPTDPA